MVLGLWVLVCVGQARGFERVIVARLTDVDGGVRFEMLLPDALGERQAELSAGRALHTRALQMTMQAWYTDDDTSGQDFPRGAVGVPGVESVATFMNEEDARRRMEQLQEQERQRRLRLRPVPEDLVERARRLYRRQIAQVQIAQARHQQDRQLARELEEGALRLEAIQPLRAEWGMVENSPAEWNLLKGPFVLDQRQYHGSGQHWPDGIKIVKDVRGVEALPEGTTYQSAMTDVFAVSGEFMTGVGIWLAAQCSYHWVEFPVPDGARAFRSDLYIGDDVHGAVFHKDLAMLNIFGMEVHVDGHRVAEARLIRHGALGGSGEKFGELAFELPSDAETIRFSAEKVVADNNFNSEIIIHRGRFLF